MAKINPFVETSSNLWMLNINNDWYYSIMQQNDMIFCTKIFLKTFCTWPGQKAVSVTGDDAD